MVPFTRVPFWVPIFDPQPSKQHKVRGKVQDANEGERMRHQKSTERSLGKAREPSMADNCVYDQSLSTGVTITGQNFWLEALSFPGALLTGCAKAFFDFRLFPRRAGQDPADVLRLGWVTAVNWEPPTNWRVLRVLSIHGVGHATFSQRVCP